MSTKTLTLAGLIPPTPSAFCGAICPWPHLQRVGEKLAIEAVGMNGGDYRIGVYFDTWVLEGHPEKGFTGVGVKLTAARNFYAGEVEQGRVPDLVDFLGWIRSQLGNQLDNQEALDAWISFATTYEFTDEYLDALAKKTGVNRRVVTSKLAAVWNPIEDQYEYALWLQAVLHILHEKEAEDVGVEGIVVKDVVPADGKQSATGYVAPALPAPTAEVDPNPGRAVDLAGTHHHEPVSDQ